MTVKEYYIKDLIWRLIPLVVFFAYMALVYFYYEDKNNK